MQRCILQERNLANAFLISFDAKATSFSSPNSTWNCGPGCPNTNIYQCKEHDYLQYSWIVFPHCSTVTAVTRVSVDKFLVSLVSNDHISYRDDFILSLLNTT